MNTPLVDTLHLTSVSRGCMAAKYDAGYFCDYVVHKIENSPEFGKTAEDRERLLQEGGLKIVTTLDLDANAYFDGFFVIMAIVAACTTLSLSAVVLKYRSAAACTP